MTADNQFYIEEYKSIRQEIDTKLKTDLNLLVGG